MADFDTLIIGSGAGGATLARTLAPRGASILLLERGERLPQEDDNWDADAVVTGQKYQTPERWEDAVTGDAFSPQAYYRVGGNTKVFGALLQRMRERDFGDLPHAEGTSPGWPLGYDAFEPFYCEAERQYAIHGDDTNDPTAPPRSAPLPFGPFAHEPRIQDVADRLECQGLRPFYSSLCLDRGIENGRGSGDATGPCIRCGTCDPFPCRIHAKRDAETAGVNPALEHANVSLWTGAYVTRLLPSADGTRVAGVEVERHGVQTVITADRVVVSCGAINSAALLLRSACPAWPDGAANTSSGLVGRGLMEHNHSALIAVSDEPNPTVFQKTLCFHDYYFGSVRHGIDHPLGSVQLTGKAPWQRLRAFSDRDMPRAVLEDLAAHCVNFWITGEDLPDDDNRVTLGRGGRPRLRYRATNRGPHRRLLQIWQDHLRDAGFHMFWIKTMGREVVWHQAGTCRFGEDPARSVLNPGCRAHDLDNLYVVDASFMPSMGATNPTLTIIANALRVGESMSRGG